MLDVWYWLPSAGGLKLENRNWLPGSGSESPLRKFGKLRMVIEGPLSGSDRSLRGPDGPQKSLRGLC